jgi:hypothetical protein
MNPPVTISTRPGAWEAPAVRAVLTHAAGSLRARKLDARPYEHDGVFGLSVRLGPAYRNPGWSTYAVLEVFDPAFPHLGILTTLDRRDDDGEPRIGPRNPVFSLPVDNRLVRHVIPAARSALASLDPAGARRGIMVLRMPGCCTATDTCALPVWMAFVLRAAQRTEQALIFTDLQRYEQVARVCARLLRASGCICSRERPSVAGHPCGCQPSPKAAPPRKSGSRRRRTRASTWPRAISPVTD